MNHTWIDNLKGFPRNTQNNGRKSNLLKYETSEIYDTSCVTVWHYHTCSINLDKLQLEHLKRIVSIKSLQDTFQQISMLYLNVHNSVNFLTKQNVRRCKFFEIQNESHTKFSTTNQTRHSKYLAKTQREIIVYKLKEEEGTFRIFSLVRCI